MSPGVNKVSSLAAKFDDSNKRHTVSYGHSNKTRQRIDLFEKTTPVASVSTSGSSKDDSNAPVLNRASSSSVMIKPHSNNLHRMSSSPNLSRSPNNSPTSDQRISRNIKTNSIRKTIGNFEHSSETSTDSPQSQSGSVSDKIARIERKPKQQSNTAFHQDRVKRKFNIRKNASNEDSQLTERFSKILQQMENEKLDSPNYKEAMNLFERKSIRFTPSSDSSWSNNEEDRLQQLLKLLKEEEMKRLEMLENMLRKERESIRFGSSPLTSSTTSKSSKMSMSSSTSANTSSTVGTNLKTLHTNSLMDKIKQEKNEIVNKEMGKEKNNLSNTPTVSIVGKPLKERPLPTPGAIVSTPLQSSMRSLPRKSEATSSSVPMDLDDFIEQKKKRLTMVPTNGDDLFQMW